MIKKLALATLFSLCATQVLALPSLQLGPDGNPMWIYDPVSEDWQLFANTGTVAAYANATTGNGEYGWDAAGAATQTAYLVASAVPKTDTSMGDVFDLTVSNDGGVLGVHTEGFGYPPQEDPHDLAGHGVFPTWFEIYEFQFDGPVTTIGDTQPGATGSGDGFVEFLDITVNNVDALVTYIHFDLFTVFDDGYLPTGVIGSVDVKKHAPFSHDAGFKVPAPATLALFGLALVGLAGVRRARVEPSLI